MHIAFGLGRVQSFHHSDFKLTKCKRNILLLFICLLVLASLFLPCSEVYRGKRKDVFVFAPDYFSRLTELQELNREYGRLITESQDTKETASQIANLRKYRFKRTYFFKELVVIFMVLDIIYIFLCIIIEKKWKGPLTKAQELIIFGWLFVSSLCALWLLAEGITKLSVVLFLTAQFIFFAGISVFFGIKIRRKKLNKNP